jgi:hypothetical protein
MRARGSLGSPSAGDAVGLKLGFAVVEAWVAATAALGVRTALGVGKTELNHVDFPLAISEGVNALRAPGKGTRAVLSAVAAGIGAC